MTEARGENTFSIKPKHWAVWFGLLVSALIFYPWSVSANWTSNSDVHALFEFWSAFAALTAGLIIMIHYFANGSWLFLVISLGFVLQGGEDLVHAIFSFSRIWGEEQPDIIRFVPGTYVTGRFILVVCILFGWFLREKYTDEVHRIKASVLVFVSGIVLSIFSTILIIQLPLPSFILPARFISRPVDLGVTLIYISAIVLYIREFRNREYQTPFVFSIICSLIYGSSAQIYMVHSQILYDSQFDMAHIMKIFSYVLPILGISFGTFSMYKNEAEHRKALALSVQKEKELAAAATAAAEAEQKKAAELAAAMLQLHANRQQLMATNQQLAANEQELRVANQQLTVKEQALREAQRGLEMKYRLIVDTAAEGIWVVGPDAMTTYVNARMTEMLGYRSEEMIGRPVTDFMFEEDASDHVQKIENRRLGLSENYEHRFHHKDGRQVWTTASAAPIFDEERNFGGSFAMFTDITERRKAEKAIEASLREKEVLLQEIHHRVKNNMAIISSLLCLQSANISDGSVRSIFADSTNRIQAMALVHEKLYQSRDLSHIKIQEYVRSLAQHIFYSYNIGDMAVDLFLEIEEVLLGIDEIIPFGLILNELISNTLKHAFGNTSSPAIRIGLRYAEERAVLTVSDNGCGFPEGFDFHNSHTLGFQLVSTLSRQLRGEIALAGEGGAHITLTFPVPPRKED